MSEGRSASESVRHLIEVGWVHGERAGHHADVSVVPQVHPTLSMLGGGDGKVQQCSQENVSPTSPKEPDEG